MLTLNLGRAQVARALATEFPLVGRTRVPAGRSGNEESTLCDPIDALILDLLAWLAPRSRSYEEVIDAWRTSCPRLPIWEEATDREYVEVREGEAGSLVVCLTSVGREFLNQHRGAGSP